MSSDIGIAQNATLKPIGEIAARLGIPAASIENYGHYKAKIALDYIESLKDKPDGKLILVTALSPTPAGEGKTTTTVGLGDALNKIGKKAVICLLEPSLGPVFGMKGGAAGGGYAQVVPMEDINLHFTGDFSAIGLAHNLLSALIDNHIHHGNELGFDVRRIAWKRVVDMNDRASTSWWPPRSWPSSASRGAWSTSNSGSATSWSATGAISRRFSPATSRHRAR